MLPGHRDFLAAFWAFVLGGLMPVPLSGPASVGLTNGPAAGALAPYGPSSTTLRPAWGMVETSASVTYYASFSLQCTRDERSLVEASVPIPSCSVRIVGGDNELVEEGTEGRLHVREAAVTQGYLGAPLATHKSFTPDEWCKTGQRGVIRDARLTVTGCDGRS